VSAFVYLLSGLTAIEVSNVRRNADFLRSGGDLVSGEDRCTFTAFLEDGQQTVVASTENILFESDGVLVVQEHSARILVFMTKGTIFNWWTSQCGQQSVVECGFKSAQLASSNGTVADVACGRHNACMPQSEPQMSYMRSMLGGALMERKGNLGRMASIGLGAGSIPLWLVKMIPEAQIEAIDVSAAVIAAAPCFGLPHSPKLKVVHDDGRKYLEAQADGSYDIIFVDVFIEQDDTVPPRFKTIEFYQLAKKKLASGGVLALNIAAPELRAITNSLQQAFSSNSGIWIGEAPGLTNSVVLARAPGGSAHKHAERTGGNAVGFASAKLWASQANFQAVT